MTVHHDFERRIADYYAIEAPDRAPDWVLEGALATIDTTPQRRAPIRAPWRLPHMNTNAKLAVAAALAVVVGAVGLTLLRPTGATPSVGTDGTPPSSPTPTAGASDPSTGLTLTETFTSPVHGITVGYPTGWQIREATEPWLEGIPFQGSEFADVINDPADENTFIGLSSQALDGRRGEDWVTDVAADPGWEDTCPPSTEDVTVGGLPGRIVVHCPGGLPTAFAWSEDRAYVFVLHPLTDVAWFRQILDTVEFAPEQAWTRPALTQPFTSEINGISGIGPAGWMYVAAETAWTRALPNLACDPACADTFTAERNEFLGFASQPLDGQDGEAWAFNVRGRFGTIPGCPGADQAVSIDGAPAMVTYICQEPSPGEVDPPPDRFLAAMAWSGDRGYLITLYRVADRPWFDDVLATVQLQP